MTVATSPMVPVPYLVGGPAVTQATGAAITIGPRSVTSTLATVNGAPVTTDIT
ncbi:MAG: hypothetical protein M5R38_07440 [Candidatus Methylomirabilis sp.]|nr:hypothetical protein [Candidatus Methylomirabilis sp.]